MHAPSSFLPTLGSPSSRPRLTVADQPAAKPMLEATQSVTATVMMSIFVVVPFVVLMVAIPLAWGRGLSMLDATILIAGYAIAVAGLTVGLPRHLTRGSFKAKRPLRIALAIAGSLAVERPPTTWVADHRRHQAFADCEGDPHSPWRYGTVGEPPFAGKDKATTFWPLAIRSFGEGGHNSHRADPTGARHGVRHGQIDPAARLIWLFEKAGWVWDVRRPQPDRLAAKRADARSDQAPSARGQSRKTKVLR